MGEVDEPAALVELGGAQGRVFLVHVRRSAQIGDHDPARLEIAPRLLEPVTGELRPLREVHVALDAAQLDARVAQPVGLVEHRRPRPAGTTERGEGDRQAPAASLGAEQVRSGEARGERAEHLAAGDGGHGPPWICQL